MAITTVDGVLAGARPPEYISKIGGTLEAAGVLASLFYRAGRPGAAVAPTPGIAGAALTTYAGQIPFTNPVSGNTYLARLQLNATVGAGFILADRLWHNSGVAVATTTAQTVNSVAWPARDTNGSTDGEGVMIAIEVSTATTNAGAIANTTMSYTNQAGTPSRTATMASFPATAVASTFVPFDLAAGDTGVRSIQSVTLGTSYGGGTIHLVAYRNLVVMELPTANLGNSVDAVTGGFVRLYDNTVPFLIQHPTTTTATNVIGSLVYTQG
jgi:hypothetical protein